MWIDTRFKEDTRFQHKCTATSLANYSLAQQRPHLHTHTAPCSLARLTPTRRAQDGGSGEDNLIDRERAPAARCAPPLRMAARGN